MCQKSWGRNSYARALVEVSSLAALKESLVVAIPFPNGTRHSLETVEVVDSTPVEDEDGFTQVKRKNGKGKQDGKAKQVAGIHLTKPKPKLVYREVQKPPTNNNDKATTSNQPTMQPEDAINIDSLEDVLDDDDEEVEEVYIEDNGCHAKQKKGASTPSDQRLCSKLFKQWQWTSNGLMCSKGSRIILGWNPDIVNVVVVSFDAQVMHVCVYFKADKKELFCSFVYAHNRYLHRRDLWNNLATHKNYIRNRTWYCVEAIEVSDVNSMGLRFTWNQKPKGKHGTLKKVERIMANLDFYSSFVGSSAVFQPYRLSDHSLAVLRIPMESISNPRPFKFYNLLVHNNRFKDIVANGWNVSVSGFWMFKVVKRLKMLKKPLRKLLYDHGNLHENVKKLRHELDMVQTALDLDPSNLELREEEAVYLQAFKDASLLEEKFLMQKAKVEWLKLGDVNTAYFHKVFKSQVTRNRIDCVTTTNGVNVDGDQVPLAFIDHYSEFLGQQGVTSHLNSTNLFCNKLTSDVANYMFRDVSDQEIREAMFVLGDNMLRTGWHPIVTFPLRPDFGGVTDESCRLRRLLKRNLFKRIVEKACGKAIEELWKRHELTLTNTGGSGFSIYWETVAPDGMDVRLKTFTNCKPHTFNRTEGVVGLKRWFKKIEQVFEICKCAEDDKVKFAVCTFEGRALTWWNRKCFRIGTLLMLIRSPGARKAMMGLLNTAQQLIQKDGARALDFGL
ncbi:hypothetical protein Tco_0332333 [Tanacetum coccineum]